MINFLPVKTGCFKQVNDGHINGYVSISLYPSKNDFINHEYKSLAPNWKLLENLNKKKITEDQFIKSYKEQLLSLNVNTVYDDLNNLVTGFEPIIMTNVSKKKFCHRHLVAEWFENELGIIIEEYKIGMVTRSNGYMKKNSNPTLF